MKRNKLKTLDLFAGAGGFTLAGEIAGGFETVAFCEIDKTARIVLDGNWPGVPIFKDVTKLKASDVGTIDVITGGFPCQDISGAGKGSGIGENTRSGLFREMLRLACEVRDAQGELPYIIFENVPRLLSGPSENKGEWFSEFLWSLAEVGYDAEWFCITAASAGATHMRERVCIVAYPHKDDGKQPISISVYNEAERQFNDWDNAFPLSDINGRECGKPIPGWRIHQPAFCLPSNGLSRKSSGQSLSLMGNAIVPQAFVGVMKSVYEHAIA